jgi:ribosomal protein S18 acetylase RimI-like enzyme
MSSNADTAVLASPLGVIALRLEVPTDEAFRFALFRASRGPGWDQVALPPDMLAMIMTQQFRAQTLGYRADYPDARLEIIIVDDKPAGRLAVDRGRGAVHLVDIAVTPDWRGQGLGTAILRQLMAEATEAALPLTLHVARDNLAAHRLYLRLGFEAMTEDETHLSMRWLPASVKPA